MPVVVRDSGMMWNKDDALEDVKCLIPDRCYARMYKTVLDDCRENGQFDVSTMGKFLIFTWVAIRIFSLNCFSTNFLIVSINL